VLDVIEVALKLRNRSVNRARIAPVDLRPARESGADAVPELLMHKLVLQALDDRQLLGPRADQG